MWQWQIFSAPLDDGRALTSALLGSLLDLSDSGIADAAELFRDLVFATRFKEFLTTPAYNRLK